MSSRNATRKDFKHVMQSIEEGLIKPADFITQRIAFDKLKEEFESLLNPEIGTIKAMVHMD